MKLSGISDIYPIDDPEGLNAAGALLSTMILAALLSLPVILTLRLLYEFKLYAVDIIVIILIPLFILFYHLAKKGKLTFASIMFFITSWVSLTIMAIYGLGIRDVTVLGYILIIFISVLLTGYRAAIVFTVLTIISIWVMAIAEANNILMPPFEAPLVYARDFSIIISLLLTGILLYEKNFRYSYQRINRELEDRKRAEEKLSKNEKFLIEQKEELLAAKLKAEESDNLKNALLPNISHEIRTPMNGIVGFAELLKEPGLPAEKSEEYIDLMMRCSDQLAGVINDLIDISKIEMGAVELNLSVFHPRLLLEDLDSLFRADLTEKGIQFKISNDLPDLSIRSDRGKISRILNNIVSNAVKFTSSGEVRIHAWQTGNILDISVADTGIGIAEKYLEHIFKRFRQAESSLTRSFGGSGLGLAICKGNVDYLGGTISVESSEYKGSVFTVSLPVEFLSSEKYDDRRLSDLGYHHPVRILIVEDDEISFLFLDTILKNDNTRILRAVNGTNALELFSGQPGFDLILMDLVLPGMSGFEVTEKIREQDRSVPIIAISSYAFEEDRKRASQCGIDDYISKPVNRNDLIEKVRKYLRR